MQSGLILFDKKAGVTSFDALNDIKRELKTGRVGHTGTLDKFASGLLLVLVGKALKLSPWFSHLDKQYAGRIYFGIETDTLDPEGAVTAEARTPSREEVESVLSRFTGVIMQEPPAYSAIHINGKRAYEIARSGNTPEMKKRKVTIYKLELLSWEPPYADIFVHCSSGTYIRSLARDIAIAAGSRAHLCGLTRTRVGEFVLKSGEKLEEKSEKLKVLPIDKFIITAINLPYYEISPRETEKILHGKPLEPILEGKELFSLIEKSADTERDFTAAVFEGETLAAVVERRGGKWEYRCVILEN